MYKKINNYIAIIGLCNLAHINFAMKEEQALKQALLKNIVSTLAINDYIINTKNSYQGFQKELSLTDDIIKRTNFTKINNLIALQEKASIAARIPIEDDYRQATRNIQCPTYNHITILYKRSATHPSLFDAELRVENYVYYFNSTRFKSTSANFQSCIVKSINLSDDNKVIIQDQPLIWLATMIPTLVKKKYKKDYCIELYSDKRVSDWIRIINGNLLFKDMSAKNLSTSSTLIAKNVHVTHQPHACQQFIFLIGVILTFMFHCLT